MINFLYSVSVYVLPITVVCFLIAGYIEIRDILKKSYRVTINDYDEIKYPSPEEFIQRSKV